MTNNCKDCTKFNECSKAKNPENYAIPMCRDYKPKEDDRKEDEGR